MKASAIVSAAVAASLGLGSISAFAQDHGWRGRGHGQDPRAGGFEHRQQPQRQEWRGQQRGDWHRGDRAPRAVHQQPQYQQRHWQPQYQAQYQHRYRNAPYYAPRVAYAGAPRYYYVGDRLPGAYWRGMRVVNDWPAYSLYQPPYGYQWVQADTGEFILVALATGLIASLLLN